MAQGIKEIIKQGKFRIVYSSAKKYLCNEGKLILTSNKLSLVCGEKWKRSFEIDEIGLGVWDGYLEVHENYYGRLLFKLAVDEPLTWRESFNEIEKEMTRQYWEEMLVDGKRSQELKKFFEMSPKEIKKIYDDTQKEREQFLWKNIKFNLDIQKSFFNRTMKDRKLKAFMIAHSYVAWYEWTKKLLRKVFKAKKGKGPEDDKELLNFLDEYPYLRKALDTTRWGLRANQIRNCVSHENFYFDYRNSELVFMTGKEKRVRLRDLSRKIRILADFYVELFRFVREKGGKS